MVISNIVENGKAIGGLGSYESKWHTDMSYNEVAAKASVLHAVEIPVKGGDTGYANMYRAWKTLPEATRRRIVMMPAPQGFRTRRPGAPFATR